MKILVTAFGPFAGRAENASSLALHELRVVFPEILTRILPVDSVLAPAQLEETLHWLRPDVLILLGEAAGSNSVRLETTAWNELDFKIPDNAGRQPTARAILPGSPASLSATLPMGEFHTLLAANGHAVSLSHDPGRYLCNQVFYHSLAFIELNAITCRTGFIHLPLAQDYPTARAAAALGHLLRAL